MAQGQLCWQERYHASGVFTLRCRLVDRPGMLGRVLSVVGEAGVHVGTIRTVGVDSESKTRDIRVFCADDAGRDEVVAKIGGIEGVEVLGVHDDVLEAHERGVIKTVSRVAIGNLDDLRMVYTPGVARVCQAIEADRGAAWGLTGICDRIAIVTNGTAVLGLGDIGALASLPVMEGKAAILAEFVGISAVPIVIESREVEVVVETAVRIAPAFGAIQLEDIAAPACFAIEEQLRSRLEIPVCHDDQHGTATVTLAALINALKETGRRAEDSRALVLGAGAAGLAITRILQEFGLADVIVYDSVGPLYRGRTEHMNAYKQRIAESSNGENISGPLREGIHGRDIFIGVARPRMLSQDDVRAMAAGPIVFPLSNPVGEISVEEALAAGAAVAADGRTINNALAYPGLFRGALDARARSITPAMQLAVAHALAELAGTGRLLPDMLDRDTHRVTASAAAGAWRG